MKENENRNQCLGDVFSSKGDGVKIAAWSSSKMEKIIAKVRKTVLEFAIGQRSTTVQTLIFDRERFDRNSAKKWARDHDFRDDKVDVTNNSIRLRQFSPGQCRDRSFRTISLTTGVQAVICRKRSA